MFRYNHSRSVTHQLYGLRLGGGGGSHTSIMFTYMAVIDHCCILSMFHAGMRVLIIMTFTDKNDLQSLYKIIYYKVDSSPII